MVRLSPRIQPPPRRRCQSSRSAWLNTFWVKVLSPAFFARDDRWAPRRSWDGSPEWWLPCCADRHSIRLRRHGCGLARLARCLGFAQRCWDGAEPRHSDFPSMLLPGGAYPASWRWAAAMGAMLYVAESFVASVESSASFVANLTILG